MLGAHCQNNSVWLNFILFCLSTDNLFFICLRTFSYCLYCQCFLSRKCGPLSQGGKDVDESLTRWKLFLVMVNEVLWKRLFFFGKRLNGLTKRVFKTFCHIPCDDKWNLLIRRTFMYVGFENVLYWWNVTSWILCSLLDFNNM